ncbi:hypothetical protein NGA_0717100 [Nannochloropsis gaditana CCMP526]|nr:hypothetical protein NGA_0717100 [Nannochloropsis gaditana CCMP526]EKU23267.1 hypothetical protein NGA_0717100 [Nannochloropsis gaditana CCMP526]|eukprot:XP_005852566.1 hypothetical protein NGA_0717100 [Nannochloropsis gaditana CCMP526]
MTLRTPPPFLGACVERPWLPSVSSMPTVGRQRCCACDSHQTCA